MRFTPHIVPHGIDWFEWSHNFATDDYILWNKNRGGQDVCDPTPILHLARQFRDNRFATTYLPKGIPTPNNISPPMGTIPYPEMKKIVQRARIYLSTVKETWGIGVLEAMASGVPVLGFAHGGNVDLVQHGETGYLAKPGDFDDLAEGLDFCLRYRDTLGENGRGWR
jgi:glycosyltransferase involved in cell wall biosynthesis